MGDRNIDVTDKSCLIQEASAANDLRLALSAANFGAAMKHSTGCVSAPATHELIAGARKHGRLVVAHADNPELYVVLNLNTPPRDDLSRANNTVFEFNNRMGVFRRPAPESQTIRLSGVIATFHR